MLSGPTKAMARTNEASKSAKTSLLGQAILRARKAHGWSQRELAQRLDYKDNSLIAKLENDSRVPSRELKRRLVLVLPELKGELPELVEQLRDEIGSSRLTKRLLVLDEEAREMERRATEIWVVSRTLEGDLRGVFRPIVKERLAQGAHYYYLAPQSLRETAGAFLRSLLGSSELQSWDTQNPAERIGVALYPGLFFMPFDEVAIFNPQDFELAAGVVRGAVEDTSRVVVLCKDSLVRVIQLFVEGWGSAAKDEGGVLGNLTPPRKPDWAH